MAPRDGAALRERIIDAAVQLLRESGARGLAQQQVARAAGIQQGHLTYYFPRKHDLLMAVAGRSRELLTQALQMLGGAVALDPEKRRQFLPMLMMVIKDRQRTRMLLGLLAEADEHEAVRARMAENAAMLRSVVANAMGRAPEDPDVTLALSMLWGLGLQQFVFDGQPQAQDLEPLLERLFDWLAAPPPPTQR